MGSCKNCLYLRPTFVLTKILTKNLIYVCAKTEAVNHVHAVKFSAYCGTTPTSSQIVDTVFDLISAHFPISAQYDNV